MRISIIALSAGMIVSACGGFEEPLGASVGSVTSVEYSLLLGLAECTTAAPDFSARLDRDSPLSFRLQGSARRSTCPQAAVASIVEVAGTKLEVDVVEQSEKEPSTLVVFGEVGGRFEPIAVESLPQNGIVTISLTETVEPLHYQQIRLVLTNADATAAPGYWDFQLANRGLL